MKKLQNLFQKIPKPLRNKYVLTSVIFVIWILFLDTFNILEQVRMKKELKRLNQEKEFYIHEIKKDSMQIFNLNHNPEEQERFAREEFLMKKDNEDIFIIRDKK